MKLQMFTISLIVLTFFITASFFLSMQGQKVTVLTTNFTSLSLRGL